MPKLDVTDNNGVPFKMHYEVEGSGPHRLVMVMGMSSSMISWSRQRSYFAEIPSLSVLYFDNPGVGFSELPSKLSGFSSSHCAKYILQIVDHLGWDRFSIVGVSMGGMISLELALLALDRVDALVLGVTHTGGSWNSVPSFRGAFGMLQGFFAKTLEDRVKLSLKKTHSSTFLEQKQSDGRTNLEILYEEKMKKAANVPRQTFWGQVGHSRIVFSHNVQQRRLEQLKQSKVHVIVVTGTDDQLVNPLNSHALRDILGCEFVEFTGAGHAIHSECSDKFNELIVAHLRRWCGLECDLLQSASNSE